MSEIDSAIENLEYFIGGDCCDNQMAFVDEIGMGIAALREQAERSNGCEYCLQGEDLAYGLDSMQRTGRIYIDGNLLTADLYSESMAVAVCCCPMCGKKLEVEP